ncbi:MAG TPA: hypothetical protein DDZ76_07845 [Xanthomonadales bacterium]|nr:hypothetical protein [Xanthomonadales bacterium]
MIGFREILLLALIVLLGACASSSRKDDFRATVYQYSAAIRWSGTLAGQPFTDPKVLQDAPLSSIEIGRHNQFRVSGYSVVGESEDADGQRIRDVQIGLINLNTLAERVISHREVWRFEPEGKRWLLMSRPPSLDGN